jgi:hypothetical protein
LQIPIFNSSGSAYAEASNKAHALESQCKALYKGNKQIALSVATSLKLELLYKLYIKVFLTSTKMQSVSGSNNTFVEKYISSTRKRGKKLKISDIKQLFCGSIDPTICKSKIWESTQEFEWMRGQIKNYDDDENFIFNIAHCKYKDKSRVVLAVAGGTEKARRSAFLSLYNKKNQVKWRCHISVDEMLTGKKWQAGSLRLQWNEASRPYFKSIYMKSVDNEEECEVVCRVNLEKILYSSSRESKRKETGFFWKKDIKPIWDGAFEKHDKGEFTFYTLDPGFLRDIMQDILDLEAKW